MNQNIGWLFYKDYYDQSDLDQINYKQKSKTIIDKKLSDYKNYIPQLPNIDNKKSFVLQTTYPGLLIGSGYQHDFPHNDAFKLGFYFDYTTGLPLIPGSSVKGVLRSAFEKAAILYDIDWNVIDCEKVNCNDKEIKKKIKYGVSQYVKELLKDITEKDWTDKDIFALEQNIFEGKNIKKEDLPIYQRDIFFDAYPVSTDNEEEKFLANDYITPHKDPLKNPIPLQFLKILPQVTFQFNFRLHDFKDEGVNVLMTAEQKSELFKQILLDLGIGAKTNVGYGQLIEDPKEVKRLKNEQLKKEEEARKKLEEEKKKQEEERQKKILQYIENKKEEEKKRIEEKRQNLEQEIKENGLENILRNCEYLREISKYLKILEKYYPNKKISDYPEAFKICIQNNMKREPKKWKRKGRDNWKKIEQWLDKQTAEQWFNELKQ